MTYRIFRPTFLIEELGELGALPDGAITNIGGVSGTTFTVGGKQVLFEGDVVLGSSNLQGTYDNSTTAQINLATGKDLVIAGLAGKKLTVSAATGDVSITGALSVLGLINGIDVVALSTSLATLASSVTVINGQLTSHLDASLIPAKHAASQISVNPAAFVSVTGTTVQEALESIDTKLTGVVAGSSYGYEYTQTTPNIVWMVVHGYNTRRVQVTIWDESDNMTFADTVSIVDSNTVRIVFNTPAAGRAILMLF
jgi:hypothetical protein